MAGQRPVELLTAGGQSGLLAGADPLALLLVLPGAVVGMIVAFLVWLHRDRPGAAPLAVFVTTASLWSMAEGLELAAVGLGEMVALAQTELILSTVIPLAWLVTVLEYTGRDSWLTRRRLAWLLAEPLVFTVLVVTTPRHDLVWQSTGTAVLGATSVLTPVYGLAFWAHLAYSLALVAAGGVLLGRLLVRSNRLHRWQSTALLAAIAVPMVVHALFVLDVLDVVAAGFDPSSLGYVAAGVVLAVGILQRELLDVGPVTRELGREAVLAEMDDPVLILDGQRRIVDANRAALPLFDDPRDDVLGDELGDHRPDLAGALPDALDGAHLELSLDHDGEVRYYDVRVSSLSRAHGVVSGLVVSLRDVTDRRQREQRLDVLNRLLRHNLRNDLNVVRGSAELLRPAVPDAEHRRIDQITSTVDGLVATSDKIGRIADTLDDDRRGAVDLEATVEGVASEVWECHPAAEIGVEVNAADDRRPVIAEAGPSLWTAVEELLTNAAEHGATAGDDSGSTAGGPDAGGTVTVCITDAPAEDRVRFDVSGDGPGIDEQDIGAITSGEETPLRHTSGVGLWLVKWIIRGYGETLSFAVDDGTTVTVWLPRTGPDEHHSH
jgi:PAS domain S-box-containing protein